MLKNLFDKGKCRLGMHAGEWRYLSGGACEQERICPRCQKRNTQVVHDWTGWAYATAGVCRLGRRCTRCGEQEAKVEHTWAEPRYVDAGSCSQARPCMRCRLEEATPAVHVLDSWTYSGADTCEQSVSCSRCGAGGQARRVAHDWEGWTASEFYETDVCVCRHCGEMVLSLGDGGRDPDKALSFAEAYRAVGSLMDSPDAETFRERITADRQLLLGPVAPLCLAFAADQVIRSEEGRSALRDCADLLERCRLEGIDSVFGPLPEPVAATPPPAAPPPAPAAAQPAAARPAAQRPAGLQGHWRSTEFLGGGMGGSMTIETNVVLDEQGQFAWWSNPDNLEYGQWSASEHTLVLAFDDGQQLSWRYQREGSNMIFPEDSRYRFWQRL